MPSSRRSIGGQGLEQGGMELGNDYSRDITREVTSDDSSAIVVGKNKKDTSGKKSVPGHGDVAKNKKG